MEWAVAGSYLQIYARGVNPTHIHTHTGARTRTHTHTGPHTHTLKPLWVNPGGGGLIYIYAYVYIYVYIGVLDELVAHARSYSDSFTAPQACVTSWPRVCCLLWLCWDVASPCPCVAL